MTATGLRERVRNIRVVAESKRMRKEKLEEEGTVT
jgi:hypothetical protein